MFEIRYPTKFVIEPEFTMPFKIIRNDITKVSADVIVNTANPKPVYGGGTDHAIYKYKNVPTLQLKGQYFKSFGFPIDTKVNA